MIGLLKNTGGAVLIGVGLAMATTAHADIESAREALSANEYDKAVAALDEVLAQRPDDAEAGFLKGLALARSGDTAAALDAFDQLVEAHPNMAEAWNNLGVLRARAGELTGARDAVQQAVTIDPQHGPAQENLGDIYVALARDAYGRAGELESDNAIARAKSEQLAAFIDSGGSRSAVGPPAGASETTTASPVANVTSGDSDDPGGDRSTPEAAVRSWASAWSAQDLGNYLAMYSDRFVPDDGLSREAWRDQRRQRLSAPRRIDVGLSNTRVARRDNQALVRFNQRYVSDIYQDRESKVLLLEQTADGWEILREGEAGDVSFTVPADSDTGAETKTPPNDDNLAPQSSTPEADDDAASALRDEDLAASSPGEEKTGATVRSALQAWAQAWSEQDMQAYLNAYSDNFEPAGSQSRVDWVRAQRKRLQAADRVNVTLGDIQVRVEGERRARAVFEQRYESDKREVRERRQMTLTREDGGWRILREGTDGAQRAASR